MDYQLKPPAKTCSVTGEPLSPGDVVHCAVLEQNGRFTRIDVADAAWNGPPEEAIGHWRRVVPPDEPAQRKPLDADSLLQYFEQMLEDANSAKQKLCYVLALLLVQKRRLVLEGSRLDGEVTWLQLVGSHGEGPYEVREFDLTDEERDELQTPVQAFLWEAG